MVDKVITYNKSEFALSIAMAGLGRIARKKAGLTHVVDPNNKCDCPQCIAADKIKAVMALYGLDPINHPLPEWLPIGLARRIKLVPCPVAGLHGDCWEWQDSLAYGYGQVSWYEEHNRVHVIVFRLSGGIVPEGYTLDHLCRYRACGRKCKICHNHNFKLRKQKLREAQGDI